MSTQSKAATLILHGTGISLLDAARLIKHILDTKPSDSQERPLSFCHRIIQTGVSHSHIKQERISTGFELYLASKTHLRPDSLRDIRYLGKRLLAARPDWAQAHFSELSLSDCEQWLSQCFNTPSQFNKGRSMLHGLFQFASQREWCDRNPVRHVAKKRIVEQRIKPLSLVESKTLLQQAKLMGKDDCLPAISLLIWAGLRPTELKRLRWGDTDLSEGCITIPAHCSKTGGVRQIDLCRPLQKQLQSLMKADSQQYICPRNWSRKWKQIRDAAGFKKCWVADVLRHTYASYHAKRYKNLPLLQLNMGHRDQSLLRSRYINMQDITQADAVGFFKGTSNFSS